MPSYYKIFLYNIFKSSMRERDSRPPFKTWPEVLTRNNGLATESVVKWSLCDGYGREVTVDDVSCKTSSLGLFSKSLSELPFRSKIIHLVYIKAGCLVNRKTIPQ